MGLWYDEVFEDQHRTGLKITETLFSGRSEYQKVEVVKTPAFGRVLVIDGIFMTSERDEFFYHEMLVHPALTTVRDPKRVLIIGGGDGGTAREVLRHPGVERVVMIELDRLVVDASKEHLPALGGDAWDDPRLELRFEDGIAYVRGSEDPKYDVVLLDGTDPVGPGQVLYEKDFYAGCKRMLAPGGAFALQSESPFLVPETFGQIQTRLAAMFRVVRPCLAPVPLYGAGVWSWTVASDEADPLAPDEERARAVSEGCKQYDIDVHRASFVLPPYVRALTAAGR